MQHMRIQPVMMTQVFQLFIIMLSLQLFNQRAGMNDTGSEVSDLTSMGFSVDVARHALMRYGNNSERALDWLLNVGEEAAAAAAGLVHHGATASSTHCGGDFTP